MVNVLSGTNSYMISRELNKLVGSFSAEHGDLAIEKLDGEDADLQDIYQALTALGLFANKKMVIVRDGSKHKGVVEKVDELLKEIPDSTELVLVEGKLDKRLSYFKSLKKLPGFKEFNELDINGLAEWLVSEAKVRGGNIPLADARYLVERVGLNQQKVSSELEKLLLYDSTISKSTIDLLTEATPQSTIFELLEAGFNGQYQRLIKLYEEQRALKVDPIQIIAMLSWQLHIVLVVKTAKDQTIEQVAKESKLNPFVLRKSQKIARGLSLTGLKQLIARLLEIDLAGKSSKLDMDQALKRYLLGLQAISS